MALSSREKTLIGIDEKEKVTYEKKSWLIFSWWVKVKAESIGKDLVIETQEKYNKIFLNGHEVLSEKRIGALRQWLNEDRITDPHKMITNEQIKMWLESSYEEI